MKQRFILPYEVETNYIQVHLLLCTCIDGLFVFFSLKCNDRDASIGLIKKSKQSNMEDEYHKKKSHTQGHKFVPKKSRILFPFILPLDWIAVTGILSCYSVPISNWCLYWQYIFHGPLCLTAYERSHPSRVGSGFLWNP
jgi:hypothetical protein